MSERPVEPSVRYIKEGYPPGLKRFEQPIALSGIWDPPADFIGGQPTRELTIYPREVTVFGWSIWPERTRGMTRISIGSSKANGEWTMEVTATPTGPAVRERAPWLMRLAWYTIGLPIWWLRSWRANAAPERGVW